MKHTAYAIRFLFGWRVEKSDWRMEKLHFLYGSEVFSQAMYDTVLQDIRLFSFFLFVLCYNKKQTYFL